MRPLFLASLTAGVLLVVYAMLTGVDRRSRRLPFHVVVEPSARFNLPLLAAFVACFGLVGSLLVRLTTLSPLLLVLLAAIGGAAAALGALALIAKWALPSAREDVVDERFLLMGHPARVTRAIGAGEHATGAIAYDVDGTEHASDARSLDGTPIDRETDVVIERVEDGIAYVESWTRVEQRL